MISQGQKTIVDFNDAANIKGGYTPRKGLMQIKTWTGPEPANFSLGTTSFAGTPTVSGTFPNLAITPHANNQQLTPYLKIAGNTADLLAQAAAASGIDDVMWTIFDSTAGTKVRYQWTKATNKWQKSIDAAAFADLASPYYQDTGVCWLDPRPPFTMTLIADIVQESKPTTIWFEVSYTDPTTGLKQEERVIIQITMVVNSQSTPYLTIFPPDGDMIRNGSPASARLIAELYRNGSKDIVWTTATCEWFVFDSTHAGDDGAGAYWDKLAHSAGVTEISTVDSVTGISTGGNQLKVFDAAVIGTETYKVKLQENGITYYAIITLSDLTDAILCSVSSSGGDVLRNGQGSSVLTANLSNGVGQIDGSGTTYTYAWQAIDQSGSPTQFRSMPYHATTLSSAASAAATTISVAAVGTAANINSLDLGDKLVLDPGTSSEEIIDVHASTAISGSGPFTVTLAAGLAKAHSSGAVVRVISKKPITTTVSGGGNGTTITTATAGFKASGTAPALEIVRIGAGDSAIYRKVTAVSGAGPYTLTLDLAVGAVTGLALVRATELAYGKSITVNADDVAVKNTFSCMVS